MHGFGRRLLALAAVGWAAVGLLGLILVLPTPGHRVVAKPGPVPARRPYRGYSVVLGLFAVLSLGLPLWPAVPGCAGQSWWHRCWEW